MLSGSGSSWYLLFNCFFTSKVVEYMLIEEFSFFAQRIRIKKTEFVLLHTKRVNNMRTTPRAITLRKVLTHKDENWL